jgi:ElaB/YqjD/DUF883 family membrane-anchored ribosome-binding protein
MDHREGDIRRDIEDRRAAMTEKVGMVAERAQETMEGVKSTINRAMAGFKQVQETVEGTTSAADTLIESVKLIVDETAERVNTTADLLHQVRQNPWIMLGGAILLGYILGSLAREASSAPGRMPDRSRSPNASVHDGHVLSETHEYARAYPTAVMPCSTCGQMVPQADMVYHSASCTGEGIVLAGAHFLACQRPEP